MAGLSNSDATKEQLIDVIRYYEEILHDIKTPLSVIISLIYLMDEIKNQTPNYELYMNMLKGNSSTILKIVEFSTSYDEMLEDKYKPRVNFYDMVLIVKDVTQSMATIASRKNIEIEYICDVESKSVMTDKRFLERALLNLLSNAIKFSPKDTTITVKLSVIEEEDLMLLEIIDQGKGIDDALKTKIFQRYKRDIRDDEIEGSGLGLNIVKNILDSLKAKIDIVNNEDLIGTNIRIRFPRVLDYEIYDEINDDNSINLFNM